MVRLSGDSRPYRDDPSLSGGARSCRDDPSMLQQSARIAAVRPYRDNLPICPDASYEM